MRIGIIHKIIALGIGFSATPSIAQSGGVIEVFRSTQGIVGVDMSSIKTNGNIRRYWEVTRFYQPDSDNAVEIRWLMDINCFDETRAQKAYVAYNVAGAVVASNSYMNAAPAWRPIVPGSNGTKIMQLVCRVQ